MSKFHVPAMNLDQRHHPKPVTIASTPSFDFCRKIISIVARTMKNIIELLFNDMDSILHSKQLHKKHIQRICI